MSTDATTDPFHDLIKVNDSLTLPRYQLLDMLMSQTLEADIALNAQISSLRQETSSFFSQTAQQVNRLHSANAALVALSVTSLVLCTVSVAMGVSNGRAIKQLHKDKHDDEIAAIRKELQHRSSTFQTSNS
jgi:hypothetical protein